MKSVPIKMRGYDDEQVAEMTKRMIAWNTVCGGIAVVLYIASHTT